MMTLKIQNNGTTMKIYKHTSGNMMVQLKDINNRYIFMELGAYELAAIEEYVDDITDELAEQLEA